MVTRTVSFPLRLSAEQRSVLTETVDRYTNAWNYCVDVAWREGITNKDDLHDATYYAVRSRFDLKSQYTCSSRDRAFEAVCAVRDALKKGKKVSKPSSKSIPVRLDKNTFSFKNDREAVSITTHAKRITVPLDWHRLARRYRDWKCISGELAVTQWGTVILRLVFTKDPIRYPRTGVIYGVDRGVNYHRPCRWL